MKHYAIAAATALSVALGAQALAQNVAVEIAPDQRTIMREYVVKEKVRPVTVKEKVAVGVTLPTDVELLSVPTTWGPCGLQCIGTFTMTIASCWSSRRTGGSFRLSSDAYKARKGR